MVERRSRKTQVGVVTSDTMTKTVVVKIETTTRHPLYKKTIRRSHTLKAHDEENAAKMGDRVRIMETRPLSKTKNWRLVKIVTKAPAAAPTVETTVPPVAAPAASSPAAGPTT